MQGTAWSCTDHVADHALITKRIIHWSRDCACTGTMADLALITWLIMHWSRGWSCTDHEADHKLITWLCMHWPRDCKCTDHVTDHALITWLSCTDQVAIMHWSSEWTREIGDGQGGLACCGSWGHKESDTTEWLNWYSICLSLSDLAHISIIPSMAIHVVANGRIFSFLLSKQYAIVCTYHMLLIHLTCLTLIFLGQKFSLILIRREVSAFSNS